MYLMNYLKHYSTPTKLSAQRALTLIELLIIIAIVAVISSIANSWYKGYIETARVNNAITQISSLSLLITDYMLENGEPPTSLSQINNSNLIDPWGRPYQYLKINLQDPSRFSGASNNRGNGDDDSGANSVKGKVRKDRNLVPLNTDYDLYSKGKDGDSRAPLTVPVSQDDVLRANNGGFIGLASTF